MLYSCKTLRFLLLLVSLELNDSNAFVTHVRVSQQHDPNHHSNTLSFVSSSSSFYLKHNWSLCQRPKDDDNMNDNDDNMNDNDDADEEEERPSSYEQNAESEFQHSSGHAITQYNRKDKPQIDWGGEYDNLRSRINDMTQYSTKSPTEQEARALFRTMTMETPNEAIMNFVNSASTEVVSAMSSAVTNLLGGLATPGMGVETIVKANGDKLGSLCFQLQMTGYMFRNAEYVLAIRDLMKLNGSKITLEDYKDAFDRMDIDQSGYIETDEIEQLLEDVYGEGETPAFEVDAFMDFFDVNHDGKISWEEFERGLGLVADRQVSQQRKNRRREALPGMSTMGQDEKKEENEDRDDDDSDDDDMEDLLGEPTVSGTIDIEMKNGKIIKVEAKEYIDELKREAEALKAALRQEKAGPGRRMAEARKSPIMSTGPEDNKQGISSYIESLGGDIQSLTKGISPVVVESMKMLVNFVIDGGPSGRKGKFKDMDQSQIEMEIPGSALQQLALWQLVLGYKLREAEATGEYRKMLE